jgi:hypothetical protein
MRRFLLCVFAVTLLSSPMIALAQAQDRTGRELLDECQNAAKPSTAEARTALDDLKATHCLGYLNGARDAFQTWDVVNRKRHGGLPALACISPDAEVRELALVVVKYLNDHPNKLHENYTVLAFTALSEAYPCMK